MNYFGKQVTFLLCWICAFHLGIFLLGRKLPYSAYYTFDVDKREEMFYKLRKTSLEALADVKAWKSTAKIDRKLFNRIESKNICIGLWGRFSGHDRLLSESLGALLARTPLIYEDRIRITVYANSDFPELDDVKNIVNVQLLNLLQPGKKRATEYAQILKTLYGQNCAYGIVLKQGVIASKGWISKVEQIVGSQAFENPDPEWILLRLFTNYSRLSYSWREPGDILLILSFSCLLCIIFWGVTFLIMRTLNWNCSFLLEIHPVVPILIIVGCFGGLVLLGRSNMPPIWSSPITSTESDSYPYAVLYPRERLLDLASEFDRSSSSLSQQSIPTASIFEHLRRRLEKERAQKYTIGATRPSLFQNIDVTSASNIADVDISFDFPDGNLPITFDKTDFLAVNKRQYFPYE